MTSKIKKLTVINFMSFEQASIEFDESNILILKGYNNSGKSALLKAFEVALLGRYETKQAMFIRDGAERFRIEVLFDDGVTIIREKMANGQSLYEMKKGRELLFSSKHGKAYGKIVGVPEVIQQYVDSTIMDKGYLNSATGNEPLLLTDTTGSENFRAISDVLKAEELHKALAAVRADLKETQEEITYYRSRRERVNSELADIPDNDDITLLEGVIDEGRKRVGELAELNRESERVREVGEGLLGETTPPSVVALSPSLARSLAPLVGVAQGLSSVAPGGVLPLSAGVSSLLSAVRSCAVVAGGLVSILEKGWGEAKPIEGYRESLELMDRLNEISLHLLKTLETVSHLETELNAVEEEIQTLTDQVGEDMLFLCKHCGKMSIVGTNHSED